MKVEEYRRREIEALESIAKSLEIIATPTNVKMTVEAPDPGPIIPLEEPDWQG